MKAGQAPSCQAVKRDAGVASERERGVARAEHQRGKSESI